MAISRLACCIALAGALAGRAAAQAPGDITGIVVESDSTPVTGADVALIGTIYATTTDAAGQFRFRRINPGAYRVRISRLGYQTTTVAVSLLSSQTANLRVVLQHTAVQVAAVTVIGSPRDLDEARDRLRKVPGAVALIRPEQLRESRQANLSDALRLTPGVYVQSRFGAADESQLSIRGSGLRNNFHMRGVNLLVNGMPYRNADGFTDFESLELLTTEAIEVHKGGNALRYGGSTLGGAINLVTKTGYNTGPLEAFGQGGSFGFNKAQLSSGGRRGGFDYYASYAHTGLDGYRDWSDQRRDRVNLHTGWILSPGVDLRSFYFFAHVREHLPGALTPAEFAANPRGADSMNVAGRWGRDYSLHHLGVQLRAQLTPRQRLEIAPYFQYRDIDHPIFRVIAQVSRDWGAELRYENTSPFAGRDNRLTVGIQPSYGNLNDRQYDNVTGTHGALRKDQWDVAGGVAAYLEDVFALTPRFSAVAGARWESARREVTDHFLSDGDQSGSRTYRTLSPKLGLLYDLRAGSGAQLFANVSRSFEPPLLLELNSLTVPGFVDLAGQDAWQFELGTRGRSAHGAFEWDVSLYDVELKNEILNINVEPFPGAPFTVPSYRNAPRTRHMGVEAGLAWTISNRVRLRTAYTFGRFTYVEDTAYAGNDIPGAPRHLVQIEGRYSTASGFAIMPSLEWVPQSYFVNSSNTARNDGRTVLGLRAEWTPPRSHLTLFLAGQNLTGKRYAATVQVDNDAGRYLEPADGRAIYGGITWQP
ncbi:MAG TPA: TonB-dependent receptor [Gemmatimonadales bacterium]|nr:TonB-dependent receptor [Gemmatimonadales bacterium]